MMRKQRNYSAMLKRKEFKFVFQTTCLKDEILISKKKPTRNLKKKCKNTFLCSNFKIHKIKNPVTIK